MPEAFSRKTLLDLASIFFLLGSTIVLIIAVLSLPITTVYPTFGLREPLQYTYLAGIIIEIVGALLGFDCFHMTSKSRLASAGVRGIVIGVVLIIASLISGPQLVGVGAVLILIAGIICHIYREQTP